MSTQLAVHNLADTIRDKVRTTIANAIPDEQVTALISAEFENFFQDERTNYNPRPSQFKVLVRAAIEKELQERIHISVRESVDKMWEQKQGNEVITDLAKEIAPQLMGSIMQSMAQNLLQSIRNGNTGQW